MRILLVSARGLQLITSVVYILAIHLVDHGCTAIIGPTNTDNVNSIQQICPQLQTPQIVPMVSGLSIYNPCNHDYLMRMSPGDELLFHAVTDVINHYSWTQISVLASRDNEGSTNVRPWDRVRQAWIGLSTR